MEHEGSLPHSQESATCPTLSQSNPVHTVPTGQDLFFFMRTLRPTKVSGLRLNIASIQEQSQPSRYDQTQYKFRIGSLSPIYVSLFTSCTFFSC